MNALLQLFNVTAQPRARQRCQGRFRFSPWILGWAVTGAILWASYPGTAQATTWYPVAETSQGQQQQFIDLDSIEPLGLGHLRVRSYYTDSRSGHRQRTDYLTEYDCSGRRFRDLEYSGPVGSGSWQPVAPDPLNTAALEYTCAIALNR